MHYVYLAGANLPFKSTPNHICIFYIHIFPCPTLIPCTPPPKTHMLRIHWRHECLQSPIDPARDLKLQSRAGWIRLVDAMIFNGFIHLLIQCGWVIPSWELTYPLKNQF